MFAKLTALIGGTTLPFQLGEQYSSGGWGNWQHFQARRRAPFLVVAVFLQPASYHGCRGRGPRTAARCPCSESSARGQTTACSRPPAMGSSG